MSLGQEIPINLWTKVMTDIFYFDGDSYLLIADYTSRFPVVRKLTSTTVQHVTRQMKLIFLEYGRPETIISDNGPCYSAEAFTKLVRNYSVKHIRGSPHYPQSNGLTEKYVQIVKNLFYKVKEEGVDLYKSLMIYRNTPLSNQLQSPMHILHSQTARSQLPMSNAARKQHGLSSEQLRVKSKNKQLPTHNQHIGQGVMYQDPVTKRWYPATITSLCQEPRSYKIRTRDGIIYSKMQNHLKLYHPQDNKDKMNNCNTQHYDLTQNRSIINKLDRGVILNYQLNRIYNEISLHTGKSAGQLPDLKVIQKSVSFVKIKPVNI